MTRLPHALHQSQSWKNGLGVSQTISQRPLDAGYDTVLWQVGSTQITADCPFSDLPGLDRQFMVIRGAGVELVCEKADGTFSARVDELLKPFAFKGDWRTRCRLVNGPVQVLNVITRRPNCSARIAVLSGAVALHKSPGATLLAVAPDSLDAWMIDGEDEETCNMDYDGVLVLVTIT